MGGQPVKKIPASTRGLYTPKVGVKYLHIRTEISMSRKGTTAFAVAR